MSIRTHSWSLLILTVLACATGGRASALTPGSGHVKVPGGSVWYQVVGDGPGTPLLVLHGGPGVPSYYLKPLAALGKDRPVIFYDQLGCGRSPAPDDTTLWTMPRFVAELAAVREALGLKQVHVLGHSWGTMLAVDYMLTRPSGVRSLVLSSPALSIGRWIADADTLLGTLPDSVRQVIVNNERNGTTDSPEYQAAMGVYYERYLSRRQPWSADIDSSLSQIGMSVYGYMEGPSEFTITGTLKGYERADRLGELELPVLFTVGRYDEARPATVRYYQSLVPGSKLVLFENSGHLTMQDEPEAYVQAVGEFLNRVDAQK
jgi:proline-specific peptidase